MAQDPFTDPRNRSPLRKTMDDALIAGAGVIANAVSPANTADQSGAQQPGESLNDFRARTQTAVDTGTYVSPTRSAFGAGAANASIDVAREAGNALFPSKETPKPIPGVGVKQPEVPKPVNSMPSFQAESQPSPAGAQDKTDATPVTAEKPWYERDGWGVGGKGGKTPAGEMPTAVRTNQTALSPTTGKQIPILEAQGITELAPKVDPVAKVMKEVDDLVEGATSGKYKGMKRNTFNQIVELRKGQLTAQLGLEGHKQANADRAELGAERNAIAKERNAEIKRLNDMRGEDKDRDLSLRSSEAFGKHLELTSPTVGMDDAGKPIKARDVGLLDIMDSGQKFRAKAPELYPAAQQLWDRREQWVVQQFQGNKKVYKAEDINKPGTETYEVRRRALKNYRDELLKRYGTPKG